MITRHSPDATDFHVALRCASVEATKAWYESTLGFEHVFPGHGDGVPIILRLGSTLLTLFPEKAGEQPPTAPGRVWHLALRAATYEHFQSAQAELQSRGIAFQFRDHEISHSIYFTDPDGTGPLPPACDPLLAGRYLCDVIGNRLTSSVGYSLLYSTLNNFVHPTRGARFLFSQDFAGVGGDTRYIRTIVRGAKYWNVFNNFIFSLSLEGGYIRALQKASSPDDDPVRLTDRFFLGSPQIRGFDIRGVGPRIQRLQYALDENGNPVLDSNGNPTFVSGRNNILDDAIGGRAYYLGRAELEIPLGAGARDLGLRPSIFADIGAVFGVRRPTLQDVAPGSPLTQNLCTATDGTTQLVPATQLCPDNTVLTRGGTTPFREVFLGDTPRPRISVGFGVNWNSPFGPFRIDIARALVSAPGDDTKLITFNVGTAF